MLFVSGLVFLSGLLCQFTILGCQKPILNTPLCHTRMQQLHMHTASAVKRGTNQGDWMKKCSSCWLTRLQGLQQQAQEAYHRSPPTDRQGRSTSASRRPT